MVRKVQKRYKKHTNWFKSGLKRIWEIICWPFKKIWQGICWVGRKIWDLLCSFWNWVSGINLVALLNLALLISIIVLFSLLIMDLRKGANASDTDVLVQKTETVTTTVPAPEAPVVATTTEQKQDAQPRAVTQRTIMPRKTTALPIKHDNATRKAITAPVKFSNVKQNPIAIKQVALVKPKKVLGNAIVDHHDMTSVLSNGTHIKGNLYIQDLRRYTLPCNIVIDGNLILRNVGRLEFCGDFTVRGNILVNPNSSFGPVPSTARIGGQVIL